MNANQLKMACVSLAGLRYPNLQQIIEIKDEAAIDLDVSKKSVERRKSKQFVMVSRYL